MQEYQSKIEKLFSTIDFSKDQISIWDGFKKYFNDQAIFENFISKCYFCSAFEIRLRRQTVQIAKRLIESKFVDISQIVQEIEISLFDLATDYEQDVLYKEHWIAVLNQFKSNSALQKQVLLLPMPDANMRNETFVRQTLELSTFEKITHKEVAQLVLSAILHPLRQKVGSCFATAPAILIQSEQIAGLIKDLSELLNTGVLKRTFLGHEHIAPMSYFWAKGILNQSVQLDSKEHIWESFELIQCLDDLKIFPKNSSDNSKNEIVRSYLSEFITLNQGKKVYLHQVLRVILLSYLKIDEKKLTKPNKIQSIKTHPQLYSDSIQTPSHDIEKFEALYQKAGQTLINIYENIFLKTWEYTVASFAETQSDFFRWNLYISLGFDTKSDYSIAKCIYLYLEKQMRAYEEKIQHHQKEYEQEFFRVKMLENKVANVESERMAGWMKVEYQSHLNEMNYHLKMRNRFIDKKEMMSQLLVEILKVYDQFFPRYFQEIYDPIIQQTSQEFLEDSPAGFRLIYKHGRQDPTLWTPITSKEEFIQSLKDFFSQTEYEISKSETMEGFKEEYAQIVTEIIQLIQTEEFIQNAQKRTLAYYKIPIKPDALDFENQFYTPWCYISGGTMEGLLRHYYRRDIFFEKETKKIANVTELLAYLVDTIRSLTQQQLSVYLDSPNKSLLINSPNHAFLFKPGWLPLLEIWKKETYSFSWIRDQLVLPQRHFLESIKVYPIEVRYFLEKLLTQFPYLKLWMDQNIHWPNYAIPLVEMREKIADCLSHAPKHQTSFTVNLEWVDHQIYQTFPLHLQADIFEKGENCLRQLIQNEDELAKSLWTFEQISHKYLPKLFISSLDFYEILKQTIACVYKTTTFSKNWPAEILEVMRHNQLTFAKPLFFADTNWPYYYFAFVLSPATLKLELWRMNKLGNQGYPMHQWDSHFSEEVPQQWSIFTNPAEYF